MEQEKFDAIMTELRSNQEQLKQDREAFAAEQRAFEQEKAQLAADPIVKRDRELSSQMRDVISAMK